MVSKLVVAYLLVIPRVLVACVHSVVDGDPRGVLRLTLGHQRLVRGRDRVRVRARARARAKARAGLEGLRRHLGRQKVGVAEVARLLGARARLR